jgi:hypothetical protein
MDVVEAAEAPRGGAEHQPVLGASSEPVVGIVGSGDPEIVGPSPGSAGGSIDSIGVLDSSGISGDSGLHCGLDCHGTSGLNCGSSSGIGNVDPRQDPGEGIDSETKSAKQPKGNKNKTKDMPRAVKQRNLGGHSVADDDIARCEKLAEQFYQNPQDMDAFINEILMTPKTQVYELDVPLGGKFSQFA